MNIENWNWPNISKDEWGPIAWNWLHLTSISYSNKPTIDDAKLMFKRIWNFAKNIPCMECRMHAIRYIVLKPPSLQSNINLQLWAFNFHNDVNVRINKPLMAFKNYQNKYIDEITKSNM
jgi:hypothetical protein